MFNKNLLKKVSVGIASLALILPLASVNNGSLASAKARKPRAVRAVKNNVKRHAKRVHKPVVKMMDDNGNVKGHHYYKFAYNRKDYRRAMKSITEQREGVKKLDTKFNLKNKSTAYRYGFNDVLNNTQHKHYVNDKQYEKGFLTADAYSIEGKVTKKTYNEGKSWFKDFKKNGPATAPAIDQIKWEAHIDTL